jgi:hypothetical protein
VPRLPAEPHHSRPDRPGQPDNGYLWGLIELAKRRLVSSLILLGLPVASRMSEDTERGMMFDFLRSPVNGPHIMTGHNTGLITLNVDEADDAKREAVRKAMREPYRTLLGHFRHEVGHYYWDRLVAGTAWMDGFHELFGDETLDYKASLQRNYEEGPPADWPLHFVSAYASTHPWEDWAECWAHYLHMRDAIDTALSFGLSVDRFDLEFTPFTLDALHQPEHPEAEQFLAFLNHWTRLTTMLNEMSRSMGQPDFYPFCPAARCGGQAALHPPAGVSRSWLQPAENARKRRRNRKYRHRRRKAPATTPVYSRMQAPSFQAESAQPLTSLPDFQILHAPDDACELRPELQARFVLQAATGWQPGSCGAAKSPHRVKQTQCSCFFPARRFPPHCRQSCAGCARPTPRSPGRRNAG